MEAENAPFAVGKTYRNELGDYQVLALHGDKMTILNRPLPSGGRVSL
jgi:hypothetical protein